MRIGINLLYLLPGIGGTETYAISLMRALVARDRVNQYVLFLNRRGADLEIVDAPNVERVVLPVDGDSRALRYLMEQTVLPLAVRRARIDVLHSMGYVGPFFTGARHIVTVHDLHHVAFPQSLSASKRRALGFFVGGSARHADRVVTISDFSRSQILKHTGAAAERVDVVLSAGSDHFAPAAPDAIEAAIARYGVSRPYVAAFSSRTPNKNIARLVEAFGRVASVVPHSLLLLGHLPSDGSVERTVAALDLRDRVLATGYVPDADVLPLLGGTDLFAFPSLYEGFGIPVVDAQRLGIPVACSTAAALPEIAGEGALMFDPLDVESIAEALRRMLTEAELRCAMIARGHTNAARFNWAGTAEQMLRIYEREYEELT